MESDNIQLESVGVRINDFLNASGLSVTEVSQQLDVSRFTVSQWLKGKNLTIESLYLLTDHFKLSLNWLIFGQGHMLRSSGYIPSENQEELVRVCRYIGSDFSRALTDMLQSIHQFNERTLSTKPSMVSGDFFSQSLMPNAIIMSDGFIAQCNQEFLSMLGASKDCPVEQLPNIFSVISAQYLYRFKCDLALVFTNGVGEYKFYQLKHLHSGELVSFIAKSALVHHGGQLAYNILFKEIA